jgi:hyaluronan synthase
MWLRQLRHLVEVPGDIGWMPAYVLFSSFFLMPIRVLGWFRMAHTAGWGTRTGGYAGGSHRLNPQAAIPYVTGALILAAMAAAAIHS